MQFKLEISDIDIISDPKTNNKKCDDKDRSERVLIYAVKTQTKRTVRKNVPKMDIVSHFLEYGTAGVLVARLN